MLKLKYVFFILLMAISFTGCSEDDAVENSNIDMPPNFASVLNCPDNNDFQFIRSENSLQINWTPCTSFNNTDVTYRILVKVNEFGCQIPAWPIVEDYYIPETFINIDNLDYYARYIVTVEARDNNANYELLGKEEFSLLSNGIFEGDVSLSNQGDVNIFIDHQVTTIAGDLIIDGNCAPDGNGPGISSLDPLMGIETITGNLYINNAVHNFTTLDGLQSLTNVEGNIEIVGSFDSLDPLGNIEPEGDVSFEGYLASEINMWNENTAPIQNLTIDGLYAPSINMLNNITSVRNVLINNGPQIINILNNVTSVNNFSASGSNFIELTTLTNATTAKDFTVQGANTLTALTNATTIERINVRGVQTLNGFETITSTISVELNNINSINSNTFNQLSTVDDLNISSTNFNVNFLTNLEEINSSIGISFTTGIQHFNFDSVNSSNTLEITIENNSSLQSITGLNNISELTKMTISANPQLSNIDFLSSITAISDSSLEIINNDQLTNLDALSNLNYIECPGQLIITDNFNLGDLCGLQNFFANDGLCSFETTIENNGYNPTPLQIANGDCSL